MIAMQTIMTILLYHLTHRSSFQVRKRTLQEVNQCSILRISRCTFQRQSTPKQVIPPGGHV